MKFRQTVLALGLIAAVATSAHAKEPAKPAKVESPQAATAITKLPISGIDMTAVDKSVRPQDDFFQYVNGTWLKNTEIPADKSRFGMFNLLDDQTQEQLKAIIFEAAEKKAAAGSNPQKLGDMYASFMDEKTIESLGVTPVNSDLAIISKAKDHNDVARAMGHLETIGISNPFGFYIYPDAKKPGVYGFWLSQSGLTLPDRDYYLKDDEKFKSTRAALKAYAAQLLAQANYPEPEKAAERILALETAIAERHMTKVESRDAEKNYNKRKAAEVQELLTQFNWPLYAKAAGTDHVEEIIVRNYPYFEKFGELFAQTDVAAWKDYMAFRVLDGYAPSLSKAFVDLHFGFHGTTLNGTPEQEPRWKRGVNAASGALGEVLGQEYVARHFSPQAKQRMEKLVDNLIAAYGESIQELAWMSDETKAKALEKLSKFKPKIGYPDKWRDYSKLEIAADDLVGNKKRSAKFELDFELARAGKAVDPADWSMNPQTVNAYYSPTRNEIVFPAAILQPPFFNLEADDAVNYGGIGGVIGHEIGHGFDDQGSKYDGGGNLRDWWTAEDRKEFDALGDRLAKHYDGYSPIEGMHVNGRLTLGENIGDLAGVTIGYRAYIRSLNGTEPPVIDGLTGAQRFYMGWAQVWRGKIREDALRSRLLSDPHSPAEYRVLGPLKQVDPFYQAFGVKEGDGMYLRPQDRVKIW